MIPLYMNAILLLNVFWILNGACGLQPAIAFCYLCFLCYMYIHDCSLFVTFED